MPQPKKYNIKIGKVYLQWVYICSEGHLVYRYLVNPWTRYINDDLELFLFDDRRNRFGKFFCDNSCNPRESLSIVFFENFLFGRNSRKDGFPILGSSIKPSKLYKIKCYISLITLFIAYLLFTRVLINEVVWNVFVYKS